MAQFFPKGLEAYYPQWNKNTGRVKEVTDHDVLVNVAKSWGVGDVRIPLNACRGFTPALDDRVFLCFDSETKQPALVKMRKSRQE